MRTPLHLLALVSGLGASLSAQDADFMAVIKSQNFVQLSPSIATLADEDFDDPEEAPFVFEAFAEASSPGALTSGTVTRPTGPDLSMVVESGAEELIFLQGFDVFAEMNGAFGSGSYTLDLVGINDGARSVSLDLSGDGYPGIPRFSNFTAAQNIDPASAMTIRWDSHPNWTAADFVLLCIEDEAGESVFESPDLGESGALNGLSTSAVVPAGTFDPGTEYVAYLEIYRPVDSNESYAAGVTAVSVYAKTTAMDIRTSGAAVDPFLPDLIQSLPSNFQPDVRLNTIVTFVFNEPMDTSVDVGQAIGWTGVSNPALFEYSWSSAGETLFCKYGPGLPASSTIQWTLNPAGSAAKLRDRAGNNLPDDWSGRFETSATSNLGEPDVVSLDLVKGQSFYQDGATPMDLGNYFGGFFLELNGISTVSSVDVSLPGGTVEPNAGIFGFNNEEIEGEAEFAEKTDLDQILPNGDYELTMHTFHDGDQSVTLNIGPDDYPNVPTIQNFVAAQAIDSSQPFTLEWVRLTGGTSSDFIEVFLEGENVCFFESPAPGEPGALDGTATKVTVPAGTLPPGRTLEGELTFARIVDVDTTSYPGVRSLAAFVTITEFEVQTLGDPFQPQVEIVHTGPQVRVTVTGERGRLYELRSSEDLQTWTPLSTQWLFGNGDEFQDSFQYLDDVAGVRERFYQARELPFTP